MRPLSPLPQCSGEECGPWSSQVGVGAGLALPYVPAQSCKGREEPAEAEPLRNVGAQAPQPPLPCQGPLHMQHCHHAQGPLPCPALLPVLAPAGALVTRVLQPQATGPRSEPCGGRPGRIGEISGGRTSSYPHPCLVLCVRDPSGPLHSPRVLP